MWVIINLQHALRKCTTCFSGCNVQRINLEHHKGLAAIDFKEVKVGSGKRHQPVLKLSLSQ